MTTLGEVRPGVVRPPRRRSTSWARVSTGYQGEEITVDLRSGTGVSARVALTKPGVPSAVVEIVDADPRRAWASCLRVYADVIRAIADRVMSDRPTDVTWFSEPPIDTISPHEQAQTSWHISLLGRDAWFVLVDAFGDGYAEALP